jgi:hypothetical protein
MGMKILAKFFHLFIRISTYVLALVTFISVCNYLLDAYERHSRTPNCRWHAIENPERLPYSARFCYLTADTVVLRLYDIQETQLLAERTFFELDRPNIVWSDRGLIYDTSSIDGGVIQIPPGLIERIRARLP